MNIDEIAGFLTDNGMSDYCSVEIKYRRGFEIGNFRPYECYETWCNIWSVCVYNKEKEPVSWTDPITGYFFWASGNFRSWKELVEFLERVKLAKEKRLW
jgi:hypothetical protein